MRSFGLALALALGAASSAEAEAERLPEGAPRWSLGAGFGFGTNFAVPQAAGGLAGAFGSSVLLVGVPSASVSAEYRINPRLAAVMGLSGIFSAASAKPQTQPGDPSIELSNSSQSFSLAGGIRYALTAAAAPITLSALGLVNLGFSTLNSATTLVINNVVSTSTTSGNALGVGIQGGLAAEKSLAENLGLRFNVAVLHAGLTRGRSSPTSQLGGTPPTPTDHSSFTFGLTFNPALELRLYF